MLSGYEKVLSKLSQNLNNLHHIIVQSNSGRPGVDPQGWCCSGTDWRPLGPGPPHTSAEQCVCLSVSFHTPPHGLGEERLKDREE